jgi:hypothetical protein
MPLTDSTSWASIDTMANPLDLVGGVTGTSTDVTVGGLGQAGIQKVTQLWHPDHPFMWFAGIAAITVGLAGVSTHLRVGPLRASVEAGKD